MPRALFRDARFSHPERMGASLLRPGCFPVPRPHGVFQRPVKAEDALIPFSMALVRSSRIEAYPTKKKWKLTAGIEREPLGKTMFAYDRSLHVVISVISLSSKWIRKKERQIQLQ